MAIAAGRQSYPCNEEQTLYTPVTTACCVPQQIPVRNMIERTHQENLLSWGPPLVMLRFWTKTSKRSVGAPRWWRHLFGPKGSQLGPPWWWHHVFSWGPRWWCYVFGPRRVSWGPTWWYHFFDQRGPVVGWGPVQMENTQTCSLSKTKVQLLKCCDQYESD